MSNGKIKALIINNDSKWAKQIQAALPDYYEGNISKFAEAKSLLVPNEDGDNVRFVIMNANQDEKLTLEMFKYISSDPDKFKLNRIPVIIFIDDEFSNRAMEYYDAGNPFFFTKEIDDLDFYLAISDALDESELWEDEEFDIEENDIDEIMDSASRDVSIGKLMGASVNVHVEEGVPDRAAAFNAKETLEKIARLVAGNKKVAVEVKEIFETAVKEMQLGDTKVEKNAKAEAGVGLQQDSFFQEFQNKLNQQNSNIPGFGQGANNQPPQQMQQNRNVVSSNLLKADNVKQTYATRKKKILVVDTDSNTFKAFQLFVGEKAELEYVDSSMKAIDFFIKSSADIVVVDYDMPFINGVSAINSILMQPNGRKAKAAVMMGTKKLPVEREKALNTKGVVGIVDKPIVKKQLLTVINKAIIG